MNKEKLAVKIVSYVSVLMYWAIATFGGGAVLMFMTDFLFPALGKVGLGYWASVLIMLFGKTTLHILLDKPVFTGVTKK
jgi:hypothetical protein